MQLFVAMWLYSIQQARSLERSPTPEISTHHTRNVMTVTAERIPSENSTGAPYVAGNFAPLRSEVTALELEVIGHVPEELTGRFLRIGPNPVDEPDLVRLVRYHWFAGTGMVHGLRLRSGKAEWFRSRFILDRDAAKILSRRPLSGPGEKTRDGNVNTSLM